MKLKRMEKEINNKSYDITKKVMKIHSQNGITIISLVITIILLLILAGIAINATVGENSIFDLAKKAGQETNKAIENEMLAINELTNYLAGGSWSDTTGGSGETGGTTGGETEEPGDNTVNITRISFKNSIEEVEIGSTITITVNIEPSNASNKTLKWTSLNSDIAVVDSNGSVTVVKEGTATIKAETTDGTNISAECTIIVKKPKEPEESPSNGKPLVGTITTADNTKNIEAQDKYGNPITIPAGFHIVPNSPAGTDISEKVTYSYNGDGTPAVQDGIVVEDEDGNQFVWIPCGKIKNKSGDITTIALGRYEFNTTNGTPTIKQNAKAYEQNIASIGSIQVNNKRSGALMEYQEAPTGSYIRYMPNRAKDLKGFVYSVLTKGGYYIARYEASDEGGLVANSKPDKDPWEASNGTAVINARNMYSFNENIESDLINSYAWDTAIVFIQKYSNNSNYANKKGTDFSKVNLKTGKSGDVICNIYDLAANEKEQTTEAYNITTNNASSNGTITTNIDYYNVVRGRIL